MGDCIRVTVRHEGLGALSKGLTASLAGIVPFCALDLVSRHIHCPLPPLPNRPPTVRAATHGRRLHRPPTDHRLLPHRRSTRRSKSVSAPPRAARPARSPFSAAAPARAPLRRCSGLRRFERYGSVSLKASPTDARPFPPAGGDVSARTDPHEDAGGPPTPARGPHLSSPAPLPSPPPLRCAPQAAGMPGHRASYASMHDCAVAVVATHGLAGLRRRRSEGTPSERPSAWQRLTTGVLPVPP